MPPRSILLVAPTTRLWPDLGHHLNALHQVHVLGEAPDPCQAVQAASALAADLLLTVTTPVLYQRAHHQVRCTSCRPAYSLAPREQAVLRRFAQGLRDTDIARAEGLSLRSVERTIAGLITTFGVSSRTALVARAALAGLLGVEDLVAD